MPPTGPVGQSLRIDCSHVGQHDGTFDAVFLRVGHPGTDTSAPGPVSMRDGLAVARLVPAVLSRQALTVTGSRTAVRAVVTPSIGFERPGPGVRPPEHHLPEARVRRRRRYPALRPLDLALRPHAGWTRRTRSRSPMTGQQSRTPSESSSDSRRPAVPPEHPGGSLSHLAGPVTS